MKERAEIVVLGAGVIGLSVAWELVRHGRRVRVLERDRPGGAAARAAAGMLAPVSEAEAQPPELIALGLDSLGRYGGFVSGLERVSGIDCRYRTEGTLWVATNRDEEQELERLAETLRLGELSHEWLDGEQVLELEPHLARRVLSGLLVEREHQVDPEALCRSLAAAVQQRGGSVTCGLTVDEVCVEQGRVRSVRATDAAGRGHELPCEVAVACAGAWTTQSIRLPIGDLGLRPIKGQILRLRGPSLLGHVVRAPDVYLVPREGGELLVGATVEEMGFDEAPTAGAALDLLRHAWQVLPGLYDMQLQGISAGLRPAVDDHLPVVGPTEVDGLYLATGHFRGGVLLAPATAHYLARAVIEQCTPQELEPFLPARLRNEREGFPAAPRGERGGAVW